MAKSKVNIFWMRRDLRLQDNVALFYSCQSDVPVLPLFIFDTNILGDLQDKDDARVTFIYDSIKTIKQQLEKWGSSMLVLIGDPVELWKQIVVEYQINAVYTNRDYEPYALQRDEEVSRFLATEKIDLNTFKDHVIFEHDEVRKKDVLPYTVFTPYSKIWKLRLLDNPEAIKDFTVSNLSDKIVKIVPLPMPDLKDLGFERSQLILPAFNLDREILTNYHKTRDIPGINGTSKVGVYLRFGLLSIREVCRKALDVNEVFVNELIWRDFYSMVLAAFPHVVTEPFRSKYAAIPWRNDQVEFSLWCEGKTGFPMVDAGMRELNNTGYMHNRVRMVVASFLTKHLLIDWRWGEAYFARKLLDYDLASNNGGWQWAAGCGTDAAPYFRIFNPTSQQKKFDPELTYIRKWIREFDSLDYPLPMVDHKMARERCLAAFKSVLAL